MFLTFKKGAPKVLHCLEGGGAQKVSVSPNNKKCNYIWTKIHI